MTLFFLGMLFYNNFIRYRYFKIVSANSWEWTIFSHEKVVNYRIEIKAKKSSEELVFDSFWIENKVFAIRVCKQDLCLLPVFKKKEILFLDVCEELKPPISAAEFPPVNKGKNQAWITYRIGNKIKHISIKSFSCDKPDFRVML